MLTSIEGAQMGNKEVTVSVGEDGRLHYAELTGPTNAEIMEKLEAIEKRLDLNDECFMDAMKTRIEQLTD